MKCRSLSAAFFFGTRQAVDPEPSQCASGTFQTHSLAIRDRIVVLVHLELPRRGSSLWLWVERSDTHGTWLIFWLTQNGSQLFLSGWHPFRVLFVCFSFRWCRCAQPPATSWNPYRCKYAVKLSANGNRQSSRCPKGGAVSAQFKLPNEKRPETMLRP